MPRGMMAAGEKGAVAKNQRILLVNPQVPKFGYPTCLLGRHVGYPNFSTSKFANSIPAFSVDNGMPHLPVKPFLTYRVRGLCSSRTENWEVEFGQWMTKCS
jgi:hypothetical protein